jgi:DNA helicase IV
MEWKKQLHEENNTKLITTFSYEKHEGVLLENLKKKLKDYKIELKPLSNKEIEEKIIPLIKVEYDNFLKMLFTFLDLFKSAQMNI